MNEKLIENPENVPPAQFPEIKPRVVLGRKMDIPVGLALDDLSKLTPDELDRTMQSLGPALGYAVLVRMAAGEGETPAGAQVNAAQFLVQNGEALRAKAAGGESVMEKLRSMNAASLVQLIEALEKQGVQETPPE